jgi:hypothetical protein
VRQKVVVYGSKPFGGLVAKTVAVVAVLADDNLLRSQSSTRHNKAAPASTLRACSP